MKRKYLAAILVLLFFISTAPLGAATTERPYNIRDSTFVLPSALQVIGDGAFEGVAAKTVVFQDGLRSIGENAFAYAKALKDVYLPATAKHIACMAFPKNKALTIHAALRSYAEEWAKEHAFSFLPDFVCNLFANLTSALGVNRCKDCFTDLVRVEKVTTVHAHGEDEGRSRRPQDRPELNPIDYRFP